MLHSAPLKTIVTLWIYIFSWCDVTLKTNLEMHFPSYPCFSYVILDMHGYRPQLYNALYQSKHFIKLESCTAKLICIGILEMLSSCVVYCLMMTANYVACLLWISLSRTVKQNRVYSMCITDNMMASIILDSLDSYTFIRLTLKMSTNRSLTLHKCAA